MSESALIIREIQKKDDPKIAQTIRDVLIEMGVPKVGTAYEDVSLDHMTETYNHPRMKYFVVADGSKIVGGAGIAPLANYEGNICELQKMYFLPEARGRGAGTQMMQYCLSFARESGFEKCYLETMPYMDDARKLYTKVGFEFIDEPMGDTGHYSCNVWMLKDLKD